jgi:hypothetical protein
MIEEWRDIEGYEGMYQVSNFGRVKSFKRKNVIIMKDCINNMGYCLVCLWVDKGNKKMKRVHRLVAQAFLPNPNGFPSVNHKDMNQINNRVDNLEWCDQTHNIRHAHKNRFINTAKGSRSGKSKLKENQVLKIVRLFENMNDKKIAEKYKVSSATIRSIRVGNTWSWLTGINLAI